MTTELQISIRLKQDFQHCWSSFEGDVLRDWTSVLEYYAQENRSRQQPSANDAQSLSTVQNTEMNFLLLHCYGGLLQHNHTGSPITVATSGYTNVRENNGNRRGVIIKIWTGITDMPEGSDIGEIEHCSSVCMNHIWFTIWSIHKRLAYNWTNPFNASEYHSSYISSVLWKKGTCTAFHRMSRSSGWDSCFVTQKFRVQIMARKPGILTHAFISLSPSMLILEGTSNQATANPLTPFAIHYSLPS